MKKYIFTESQLKRLLDGVISEQSGKLNLAFDNDVTNFEGVIGKDGYLYPYTEMRKTWKIGPISKVPFVGQTYVEIVKKGGKEEIYVTGKSGNRGRLEMDPNYTVEKVDYKSIPR